MTPSALPLVSIITPTYNMAKYLSETIESVLAQDYPNIEYIVVDGGSTDGSLEILERYQGRLRYFSEPDRGPSDAAAKGFRQARGEIFAWLNADDTYLPGAVRTRRRVSCRHIRKRMSSTAKAGGSMKAARIIGRYPTLPFDPKILERECFICQPAAFIRAEAYRRCELDPAITQAFDYDLWIRMAKAGIRFAAIPRLSGELSNARRSQDHLRDATLYSRPPWDC